MVSLNSKSFIWAFLIISLVNTSYAQILKSSKTDSFTYDLPKNYMENIEKEWSFIYEKDGIKVYSKKNNDQGPMAFRGRGIIKAGLNKVLATLINLEKSPEWTPNLILKKMVKQHSITDAIIYNYNNLPWPASNRDSIIRSKLVIDKNNKFLNIISRSVPYDFRSPNDGRVRGVLYSSNFIIKTLSNDEIYADLDAHFDAKGLLPNFIINIFQKDWPYKFLKNLEKQARKDETSLTKEQTQTFNLIGKQLQESSK